MGDSLTVTESAKRGKWDYELYLSFDLYTKKHTQWFYFSVRNMRKGQTYRFTIVNLYKAGSLYNEGMQPVMYSTMEAMETGVGWRRRGHNIKYFKTPLRRLDTKAETYYFGLTWSHTFEYEEDTCYFAHCYPYTYSDLRDYLHKILANPVKSEYCKQRVLCHSMAGNPVPLLTITSPIKSPEENLTKRAVVITSRVHPGETNGSWMMKGLLDFLIGDSPDAKTLRDSFVFKVAPMLNPDGVIVGNYRCSLAGRDLNRNYRTKLKDAYPTVWHIKAMVKRLKSERDVVLYCDLHGHSRKQNVFIYGCDSMDDEMTRLKARVFPKMLSKNAATMFSLRSSRFGVHKSKEGTGRVVMWREMGITNSYTMESTFCGSLLGALAGLQFRSVDLERMGHQLCDTILDYCDPDQSKVELVLRELENDYRASVLAHLASLGQVIPSGVDPLDIQLPALMDMESSDAGSDSSVSDGPPVHYMAKERRKKKKRLKSRRERNQHKELLKNKAIIKLSHHNYKATSHANSASANHQQPSFFPSPAQTFALHDEKKSGSAASVLSGELAPKNSNGIPIFVQERLEERQKRRIDEFSERASADEQTYYQMEHVDAVALDYLKQGIPPHLSEVDPRSSMSSLPRFPIDCPISITPMALCEAVHCTRPPSRAASRTSLPQLIAETRNHGAFTSHYLANHLQDVICPPGDTPTNSTAHVATVASSNSTRNLATLSHLFRQLRPHLVNSERQAQKSLQWQVNPEKDVVKNPSKVEFYSSSISHSESSRQLANSTKHLEQLAKKSQQGPLPESKVSSKLQLQSISNERVTVGNVEPPAQQQTGSNSNPPLPSSPPPPPAANSAALPEAEQRGALAQDVHSSHSSLGRASSSLTNSWESFSKPLKLSGRVEKQATASSAEVSISDQLTKPAQQSNNHDAHLRTHRSDRHKILSKPTPAPNQQATPTQSVPNQLTPISEHASFINNNQDAHINGKANMSVSIMEHKRHVSEAVENIHSDKKKKCSKKKKLYKKEKLLLDIEEDDLIPCAAPQQIKTSISRTLETLPQSISLMRPMDHTPFTAEPHPLVTSEDLYGINNKNSNGNNNNTSYTNADVRRSLYDRDRIASTLGGMVKGIVMSDDGHEYFSELVGNMKKKHNYTSPSVHNTRMFSSKPASRSGIRSSADQRGMAAVNMAFTIGRHEQPRPSTNYSFRKPRPIVFRSHSRNSASSFSDM